MHVDCRVTFLVISTTQRTVQALVEMTTNTRVILQMSIIAMVALLSTSQCEHYTTPACSHPSIPSLFPLTLSLFVFVSNTHTHICTPSFLILHLWHTTLTLLLHFYRAFIGITLRSYFCCLHYLFPFLFYPCYAHVFMILHFNTTKLCLNQNYHCGPVYTNQCVQTLKKAKTLWYSQSCYSLVSVVTPVETSKEIAAMGIGKDSDRQTSIEHT